MLQSESMRRKDDRAADRSGPAELSATARLVSIGNERKCSGSRSESNHLGDRCSMIWVRKGNMQSERPSCELANKQIELLMGHSAARERDLPFIGRR